MLIPWRVSKIHDDRERAKELAIWSYLQVVDQHIVEVVFFKIRKTRMELEKGSLGKGKNISKS